MAKNTLHWNDLEEHLTSIKNTIESRFQELETREKDLAAKESNFIKSKNDELVGLQRLINEKVQEVIDNKRECTLIEKKIQERKKKLSWVDKSIEDKLSELNKFCEDVKSKSDEIEECERKLRLREERLKLVEKSIDEKLKLAKLKEDEVIVIQESLRVYRDTIKAKERELDTMLSAIFEGKKREMGLNSVSSELQEKEMQVESLAKELNSTKVEKNGGDGNNAIVSSSMETNESTINISDGRSLQLMMYEEVKRNCVVSNKISFFLQQETSEPAKLVLDAMQGFYPSNVTEGNQEFDLLLLRKTCILLLDEFYRLSPQISPEVKEEAMKLASDWKAEMKVESENWLEVLGYLRLITTYDLTCAFDGKELQNLIDIVAQHEQATELSRVLCTADEEAAQSSLVFEVAQQEQAQEQKASVVEPEQQQQQKRQEQKSFKVKQQHKKGKKRGGRFDHQQQQNKFRRTSVLSDRPYQQHQNSYPGYHRRIGHPVQMDMSANGANYGYGGLHILPQLYPCPPGFGRPL